MRASEGPGETGRDPVTHTPRDGWPELRGTVRDSEEIQGDSERKACRDAERETVRYSDPVRS